MVLAVACVVRCFFGESGLFENEPTAFLAKVSFPFFVLYWSTYTPVTSMHRVSPRHIRLYTHTRHTTLPRAPVCLPSEECVNACGYVVAKIYRPFTSDTDLSERVSQVCGVVCQGIANSRNRSDCEPLPKPTLSPFALARPGSFLRVGFFHCRRVVCACSAGTVGSFS